MRQSQLGLIFNGLLKVPMQFFILLVGVMVFVFYQFNPYPLNFNPSATQAVMNSEYSEQYQDLSREHQEVQQQKQEATAEFAALTETTDASTRAQLEERMLQLNTRELAQREEAKLYIEAAKKDVETNDKDYVFIHFILNNLPRGLIGLLLAVILSAAMSSTSSELNALASTTVIDLYKRNQKTERSELHYVKASKWFTLIWGVIAIAVASVADLFDNLIQLVNIIGSIFYGNVLGIFLLAFFIRYVKSTAVFIAAIITQILIIILFRMEVMPYLWLNLVGCGLVMAIAIILQTFDLDRKFLKK